MEVGEIPGKEFKSLVLKMTSDLKEDSNEQMSDIN
jgi:hypothetical protein